MQHVFMTRIVVRSIGQEQSKRQRLIDQTSAAIESNCNDKTYVEIGAVKHCIEMLKSNNVVVLSGREGSGKSRNGLEILRQLKETNPFFEVFKLTKLLCVSDILKSGVTSVILFEDVFENEISLLTINKQIRDSLFYNTSLFNVKFIFEMRNTVKDKLKNLLSTHKIFVDTVYVDLDSQPIYEKEKILTNYCSLNEIKIVENSEKSGSVDHVDGTAVLGREAFSEIIKTCPYLGFAECCRKFTGDKTYTNLGSNFFKYPQKDLIHEIEKIRVQGLDSYRNGLKYVTLIYILTLGKSHDNYLDYLQNRSKPVCLLIKKNIETHTFNDLFKTCYNSIKEVRVPDIIHVCEELTCRYLVYKEETYYFQHQAIQESVLISYSKIYPQAIIPMLSIDHMVDIVRLENSFEQENEAIIKISNENYYELTRQFILVIKSCKYYNKIYRLENSKIIKESDTDFIYSLINCLKNERQPLLELSRKNTDYVTHYLPLFLLTVTGNIDCNTLITHQEKQNMLLSFSIADKILTFSVDPHISISYTLFKNDASILKWLLANTDHSLIDMNNIVERVDYLPNLEIVSLLLVNFNQKETDMTQLILRVCLDYLYSKPYNQIGGIIDLVEESLVDYQYVIIALMGDDQFEYDLIDTEMILYLLKRINLGRLDLPELVSQLCEYGCFEILKWVLENVHHELFDREGLIDLTLNSYKFYSNYRNEHEGLQNTVELLLKTPGMKCINVNDLVKTAIRHHLYGVVEAIIKDYSTTFINADIVIANAYIDWRDDEDYENDRYSSVEWQEFATFIANYCSDYTEVETISEKACEVGQHNVVDALMNKIDINSFFFTNILDQLLSQDIRGDLRYFDEGHGMLLQLLLPRVNYSIIDLNNVMNDLCRVGHLQAILLLLTNNPSYNFEMKHVMNKACYYGDLKLVKYLFKNYSVKDFDYKTAMIKACRNSKGKTLDVCKWLWANINRKVFDMNTALNNASRCNNSEYIVWTLATVDTRSYDIESATLIAIEHGISDTVQLLLDKLGYMPFDFQSAICLACRNRYDYLNITKLLFKRADHSNLDVNTILSIACKCFKTDIVQWIIETCYETSNENNACIKSLHKYLEMNHAMTCILDIDDPGRNKKDMHIIKNKLLWLILQQTDLRTIDIFRFLTESCKMNWENIFKYILIKVDRDTLNIGEIINVACHNGALNIVKWSLENIDLDLVDVDTVIIESCSYGWIECLEFIMKNCRKNVFNVHYAMHEACTYGRLLVADWLLHNFSYESFNLQLLLKEACRNGWIDIFRRILTNFPTNRFDLQNSISEAVSNGHLEIVKWTMSKYGRDCVDGTSLSKITSVLVNEAVLEFLLQDYDPMLLDIATVMTNACKYGWKNIAASILDKDFNNLCDLSLAFNTACDNGELEIVQLLLDKVDPHILTTVDKAMHSVAVKGWDEIAILLLDKVEHTRLDIGNALIEACRHGEIDVVQAIFQKVDNNMLDVKAALDKACENHMHEELVLCVLENIDQEQADLKTVKIQAIRYKWRKVQFALTKVDIENLNEVEQETETDNIIFLE